jgi:NADH:ubiquinone oxidoreductase subunit 3 (subunit A)
MLKIDFSAWYVVVVLFLLQLIVTTVLTYFLNKKLKERDKKQEEKDEARLEYEQVMLGVTDASAKLSYALAMAIKRGSPNGEVEAGIDAYNEAMKEKDQFLQRQALYRIAS